MIRSLWISDSATSDRLLKADSGNNSCLRRLGQVNDIRAAELICRIDGDFFNSDSMLINGVDMNTKLKKKTPCSVC